MVLSRDEILSVEDLRVRTVDVPEWGGQVLVRELSAAERDDLEGETIAIENESEKSRNLRARIVVRCVVDEKGERVFGDKDAELVGRKSGAAVDRIFQVASELSGLSKDSAETLEKN